MRNNQRIFIFLMTFFVVVAIGSLAFLSQTGSAFNRTNKSLGAETAALTQTVINSSEEAAPVEIVEDTQPEPPVVEDAMETAATEAVSEPEPEVFEKRYFSYKVDTKVTILRLREQPSEFAEVKAKLAKGSGGYVLVPGNQWCKVVTSKGNVGYCSTEYLILTEMTVEEYPEKYIDQVEAPAEALSAPFESLIVNSTEPDNG